jgi:hypothetical protein
MLSEFRHELGQMWTRLPEWFDVLPRDKPVVAPMPEFEAATAPGAFFPAARARSIETPFVLRQLGRWLDAALGNAHAGLFMKASPVIK